MLKWFLVALGSFFGLVLLLLAIPFILNPFVRDAELKDDSDIRPFTINIPDAENAYFDVVKAIEAYVPNDKNDTDAELVANTRALELFALASTKKYYQQPEFSRPETINIALEVPRLNALRSLSVLKQKEAERELERGNTNKAIAIALQNVKLGKLIQESQSVLMTTLIGNSVANSGHEAMQEIFTSTQISSHDFTTKKFRLDIYEPDLQKRDLFARTHYQQYSTMLDFNSESTQDGNLKRGSKLMFWFKPNETHNMFIDLGKYWIDNINKSCKGIETQQDDRFPYMGELEQSSPDIIHIPKLYLTPNIIGKFLYSTVAASLGSASIKQCQSVLQARNLAIAIALHSFKQTNGTFPASLDQLVPNYIDSIPVDPYTEQPPLYSIEDRIIYSETYDVKHPKDARAYHF